MTEKENNDLKQAVIGSDVVPKEFEIEYLQSLLSGYVIEKNRLICNYRLVEYLGDDERKIAVSKDMKKIRDGIEFLEKRIASLQ